MSGFTVVESTKAKKAAAKKAKNTSVKDQYDLIIDRNNEDNLRQYQRLKDMIASQISDTDGIDAAEASTPELAHVRN